MSKKPNESNRPTHAIWLVTGEGEKSRWNRIGSAWLHNDKKGANLKFESFPLTGRVVIREIEDNITGDADAAAQGGEQ
ncbi:MAG: hypothetical protein EBS23_00810 [Betaproteobacteria bacterium]|nr:hypothetical protein [Betaproteobacteria bacterium]